MMHQEVLKLVPELKQKNEEYNKRRFKELRRQNDQLAIEAFRRKVENMLTEQHDFYEEEFKEKDEEIKTNVNDFLSEEAESVRRKRWLRKNSAYYRKVDFEGQKRLLASLQKAKQDFIVEKGEALAGTLTRLNIICATRRAQREIEHQKQVDALNDQWLEKYKIVQGKWQKKREKKLNELEAETKVINEQYDKKIEHELEKKSEDLELKKEFTQRRFDDEVFKNTLTRETIEGLEEKSNNISLYTSTVMKSFIQFVCSTKNISQEEAMKTIVLFKKGTRP